MDWLRRTETLKRFKTKPLNQLSLKVCEQTFYLYEVEVVSFLFCQLIYQQPFVIIKPNYGFKVAHSVHRSSHHYKNYGLLKTTI